MMFSSQAHRVPFRNLVLQLPPRMSWRGSVALATQAAGALLALCAPGRAQCASWSADFAAPGVTGTVHALAAFDDGSTSELVLGGTFLGAGGVVANRIVRFDGAQWSALGSGLNNDVLALLPWIENGARVLIVGGNFTSAGGLAARGIARWNGTSWSSLAGGTNLGGAVHALAVFDDGQGPALYAGGSFSSIGGVPAANLARWDGSAWTAVGGGLAGSVRALAVHDEGHGPALLVGGSFASAGLVAAANLARWNGSSWSAVGGGTNGEVDALCASALPGTPALYVGGKFGAAGGWPCQRIACWSGGSWSALGSGVSGGDVAALFEHDDGSGSALYAGGSFLAAGTAISRGIARWRAGAWSAVGSGVDGSVSCLAPFDDGSGSALHAGGFFLSAGGAVAKSAARWSSTGWSALGTSQRALDGSVRALLVHADGQGAALFAGGMFTHAGAVPASHVARYDRDGWSLLGSGTNGDVWALARFDEGAGERLFAAGNFTLAGGVPASNIARWDGAAWSAVGGGVNGRVQALAVHDDGSGPALYATGHFTQAGGNPASRIARWNGASWSALGAGFDAPGLALCVHAGPAGPALYAGGGFATAGGLPAAGIACWNGASWTGLGLGVAGGAAAVKALASFNDGDGARLYLGGSFTQAGLVSAANVACWDGLSYSALAGGITSVQSGVEVAAFSVCDDGSGAALVAGGYFTHANGQPAYGVARWDGSAWSALGLGVTPAAYALAVFDDGLGGGADLYAGGALSFAGGQVSDFMAEWYGCGTSAVNLCAGDGSAAACPCANVGSAGHGCPNSGNASGASLDAAGLASLLDDSLVLYAKSMPQPTTVIFYQGDALVAGGQGAVFGDGLSCVGGHALRLRTLPAPGGAAEYPAAGDAPLSSFLSGTSGAQIFYSAIYRDTSPFCTASTWNGTNAVAALWQP